MLMRIFFYLSLLDPVMIILVLNGILDIVHFVLGRDLLEEIGFVMILMLYFNKDIQIIRCLNLSELSKINTNLEINVFLVKSYIGSISVSRAARYVSRDSISRMLNDLSSILVERLLR